MRTFSTCNILATAIAAIAILFTAHQASADTLTVTYSPTLSGSYSDQIYVSSNAGTVDETFTFTNSTAYSLKISSIGTPSITNHNNSSHGDPGNTGDLITGESIVAGGTTCSVGLTLTANGDIGDSCTVELQIAVAGVAPATSGGADKKADYGDNLTQLTIDTDDGGKNGNSTGSGKAKFVTTVDYPTPEPSSLLLLGSGMLGLAGLAHWKFRRN